MAVARIVSFRPRPERYDECLGRIVEYKRIIERIRWAGASVAG